MGAAHPPNAGRIEIMTQHDRLKVALWTKANAELAQRNPARKLAELAAAATGVVVSANTMEQLRRDLEIRPVGFQGAGAGKSARVSVDLARLAGAVLTLGQNAKIMDASTAALLKDIELRHTEF